MKIYDTHTHYDDERYSPNYIADVLDGNTSGFCAVGCNLERSRLSVGIAERYGQIAAVGIHPQDAPECNAETKAELSKLAENPVVKAIGEIGLDYHYDPPEGTTFDDMKAVQKQAFIAQLQLAENIGLPLIVHSRDAMADTLEILYKFNRKPYTTVFHCFSGSAETATELHKHGILIGVGGTVTYKNAKNSANAVRAIPLEYILLETDCPYLSPVPLRGTLNHSGNLSYVIEKIAEIKGITVDEVVKTCNDNAARFFKLA
ncbi:MAG: TatD family hydrolase [Oscillospiraceae bacterium]|jgi:TatD DNase family protein|nr:TatD family hydrolase [Oscillospiraceae bacterium]